MYRLRKRFGRQCPRGHGALNSAQPKTYKWVTDGARTRDPKDHNLVLCQLSYGHHIST
jgi:hypothetical protein